MGQFRSPVNFGAGDSGENLAQKLNDLVLHIERAGILGTERQVNNATVSYRTTSGGSGGGGTSLTVTDGSTTIPDTTSISVDTATGLVLTSGGIGAASIALSQDIRATASPTFAGLTLTSFSGVLRADAGVVGDITDGAANTVLGMDAAGTASEYKTVTGGDGITVTPTAGDLDIAITPGTANQILGTNAAADASEWKTLTGGTGITVTHTVGGIDWAIDFTEFDHGDLSGLDQDDHTQYMHNTTQRTVTAVHIISNGFSFGTTYADAGYLRLPNTGTVAWRNAADGANETLSVNASDQFVMTGPLVADAFIATGTAAAAGAVRLVNNTAIAWRNAANGADETLTLNGSDGFVFTGPVTADHFSATGTVASAGAVRLANNTAIAWRNSEDNADVTLTVGADEIAVFSGALNAASLTLTTELAIAEGGTGGGTAQAARVNILPSMAGKGTTYYLRINAATDDVEWATVSGGSAAGSDTYVQFNDGGTAFGGDAGLVYDKTTNILTISDALKIGATVSSAGAIRLANNVAIGWRNSEDNADVTLTVTAAEVATFSGALSAASLTLTTDLPLTEGGTGGSTRQAATVNILPSMAGKGTTYYLRVNAATDDAEWATVTATATPGGSDAQIQYNNGGAMGGTSGFEWLDASGSLKYYVVAGPGLLMHTGSVLMNQVDLTTSSVTKLLIKASVVGDLVYIENTSTNPIMALKGGTTSGGVTAFSIRNSTPTIIMDLKYDGAFAVRGAGAGLTFQERDGSPDWQWYATSGTAILWDGAGDTWKCDESGNITNTGRIEIQGAVTATAGNIHLNHGTSNYIYWRAAGLGVPAATTRTAGAKLVLWPGISASATDYAIGIDSSVLWFGVPATDTMFKMYHYTTITHMFGGPASAAGTRGLTVQGIPPSYGLIHLIGNADNAESAIQFADASDATDATSWLFGRSIVTADQMEFWYNGTVYAYLTTAGRFYVNGEVAIDGDLSGGVAGCNTFTGASTLSAGGATFTVKGVSGATARDNSGWIKMYVGTTAYYFPVWATITG